jgi:cystathionine beta-lyase/cystathionine gamma-synthase
MRGLSTRSVQGNRSIRSGPAVEPVFQTSTFVFENQQEMLSSVTGKSDKHVYTRWSNPTTRNVEEKLSALEGTEDSLVLSSGMAAISSTVLGLLSTGDRILSCDSIYGGTLHLFEEILPRNGIHVDLVGLDEFADRVAASKGSHKMCYFETPTNPILRIVDIRAVAEASSAAGLISVIDNTFATPINQRPHEMGIDIIIHSATKYLGGHSDLIAGTVSSDKPYMNQIRSAAKLLGGTVDPFASFLLDRGIKTLAIRVERHNSNAGYLAERLSEDGRIRKVHYPGLRTHPHHDIACSQMDGFGGMLTIELDGDLETTERFVDSLNLFLNAVSLGGVQSLASIPVITTHYGIDRTVLERMNISDSTVRLSVGIEDPEDLLDDVGNALNRAV